MATPLNRRKEDRYPIQETFIEGLGTIIEAGRRGLKIKKEPDFNPKTKALSFSVAGMAIYTEIKWDEGNVLGLEIIQPLSDPAFFIKKTKKPKEILPPPQMKVSPDALIPSVKKEILLTALIDLLLEVEAPEPDLRKISTHINAICRKEEEETKPETEDEILEIKDAPPSCRDELISRALQLTTRDTIEIMDVHFAVNILGVDLVREHTLEHIRKRLTQVGISLPGFENFDKSIVLKAVFFKALCRFFGLQDLQAEGSSLLSSEGTGYEILIKESSGILDSYYRSSSRLYAEISRAYEKAFFGTDPLQINRDYFEKSLLASKEMANGYILSHCTLHPHYILPDGVKVTVNKNGLIFSFLTYLTYLALQFLLDKNRISGSLLAQKLKGKGMDLRQVDVFIDQTIAVTETILRDLRLGGKIFQPSWPDGTVNLDRLLGKTAHFKYLHQSFERFDRLPGKRLALRYEDEAYAHFILGRVLMADGLSLTSKSICVIPCQNISEDPWYIKDFNYFDLLVFKDFPKLSPIHLDVFLKLWETFEGQIIATFSYLHFLDFTKPALYKLIREQIVDFPSSLINQGVYEKMVDQTIEYLSPYLPEKKGEEKQLLADLAGMNQKIDKKRFLSQVLTMNHIKTDILLTEEIT